MRRINTLWFKNMFCTGGHLIHKLFLRHALIGLMFLKQDLLPMRVMETNPLMEPFLLYITYL